MLSNFFENASIQLNDEIQVIDKKREIFYDEGSTFKVIRPYDGVYAICAKTYLDGTVGAANSYSFHKDFYSWRKDYSTFTLSKLVEPGKPLLLIGNPPFNLRIKRFKALIDYLKDRFHFNEITNKFTNCNSLEYEKHFNWLKSERRRTCKDSIMVLSGLHNYKDFPDPLAMERLSLYFMKNKQRRIILTGNNTSLPITKSAANIIDFSNPDQSSD